ncbi:MAG: sarcosine oxidase subunit gamma family protein [Candidatus Symbiobacter sp.]|nr:sarcosine oxidase subunit gamma family protein [Candidatus Symbiobacter sp.]
MTPNLQNYDVRAAAAAPILAMTGWDKPQAGIKLTTAPPAGRFNLRGSPEYCRRICEKMSLALPPKMLQAAGGNQNAVLWLGPDEYYLYTEDADKAAHLAASAASNAAPDHGSLVDNSHRFVGFHIEGENVATLLMAYCPLDVTAAAFPVGKATRTIMAKIDVLLWRQSETKFHIEIARSFAQYGLRLLAFAASNQAALRQAGLI